MDETLQDILEELQKKFVESPEKLIKQLLETILKKTFGVDILDRFQNFWKNLTEIPDKIMSKALREKAE